MPHQSILTRIAATALLLLALSTASAQQQPMPDMPGMDMSHHGQPGISANLPDKLSMPLAHSLIEAELQHLDSGTSIEPDFTRASMVMAMHNHWMFMVHGNAFVADIQQQAANDRGADKLFSTNWIMPMAQHKAGPGWLTLRAMFSLEPATITGRFYPELFQQGETAYGKAIVDGQHPHDFFMEIAALYDVRLGEHALLSLYAAPVGDPAIGPTAYPHRLSASEDPIAALGHHQEDSTHIAFNVATAGLTWRWLRIEGSGFHGAEPTESRWQPEPSPNGHAVDSYSTRLTVSPTPNLSGQYSIAHITRPESLHPNENQQRQTASMMYNRPLRPFAKGIWSNTLVWGHTHSLADRTNEDSYLAESLLNLSRNYLWTRIESAARTTELLNRSLPEKPLGHVQAYTLGYDREYRPAALHLTRNLLIAPGVQFTLYRTPDSLSPTYGRAPFGAIAFIRFRLAQ